MDFLSFYGLKEEPFRLTPDPAYFLAAKSHNNALLSLNYSAHHREGFTLLVGEPGTGKTTLLNVFIDNWIDRAEIAMILTPRLSPEEFLLAVLDDFGIRCQSTNKNEIIRRFRDFLIEKSQSNKGIIIVVDEAQNLPDETLEELRLLSNMETDKEKLLHIILIGQPELLERLESHAFRQFNQRIVTRLFLAPLDRDGVREYLNFRLFKAGRGVVRFSGAAVKGVHKHSRGIPRLVNSIATRAMMSAFLEEAEEIRPRHVTFAVKSLQLEEGGVSIMPWLRYAFACVLTVAVALAIYFAAPFFQKQLAAISLPADMFAMFARESAAATRPAIPLSPLPSRAEQKQENSGDSEAAAAKGVVTGSAAVAAKPPPAINQQVVAPVPQTVLVTAVVTAFSANVRETPGPDGKRRYLLYRGEEIRLTEESVKAKGKRWYRTEMKGNGTGWISAEVVRIVAKKER